VWCSGVAGEESIAEPMGDEAGRGGAPRRVARSRRGLMKHALDISGRNRAGAGGHDGARHFGTGGT
jgi:hypothetical protein